MRCFAVVGTEVRRQEESFARQDTATAYRRAFEAQSKFAAEQSTRTLQSRIMQGEILKYLKHYDLDASEAVSGPGSLNPRYEGDDQTEVIFVSSQCVITRRDTAESFSLLNAASMPT
jgi:hypothetical protein